ncbi:MAG: alpha-glucan phosphorylase [Bacteroidetes bacterium]|jgi:starch phosphorylase|nr:alpha-glucan phosphorylase [Bacteroidota bacterium]
MTRPIHTYTVAPSLPKELESLHELVYNLLWVWDHDLMELLIRLDPDLWEKTNHNPVLMLGMISQERLNTASRDDALLAQLERGYERYKKYLDTSSAWFHKTYSQIPPNQIAYFSAEFGITECLQNYSGGLGVLSGDHLKSASDLGLPLIGVGLLYQQGYFRQYLNIDGWQQERNPENDFYTLPIALERDGEGKPIMISVDLEGRPVYAQIWRVQVGRIPLYLLDTNIPLNSQQEDQNITDQLYGGDRELRIRQEILLGIGGYRALKALGLAPAVFHMNEGHSAFLSLERCRDLMQTHKLSFPEAREASTAGLAFTTHTPVPAGNDYFTPELVERYFGHYYRDLGLSPKEFHGLGRQDPHDEHEAFCMTILALKMAGNCNGVAKLHGVVSRKMWQKVWPGLPENEIPIISITNGVHAPSWISRDMAGLYDRYLGPRWREDAGEYGLWSRVHHIPDEELWRTHERRRERLVAFARSRLRSQLEARGAPPSDLSQAAEVLNSQALTIGFARRFATYKRSTLLLRDDDRLIKILTDKDRPVQIIFAGKAHPHDNPGKDLIRQIVHFERRVGVRRRMVFLEDYDMVVARYMVQGVDVWLNTPRRPLEASGTSGMKATLNGAINLSVLDGWWDEAYNVNTGWAIGRGEEYTDETQQDEIESNALYDLLEKEIVPLFYSRGADDLPRQWITKMKGAMRAIGPEFNTNRMVREYTERMYLPALDRGSNLSANKFARARQIAVWKHQLRDNWQGLKILEVSVDNHKTLKVGESLTVRAHVDLSNLKPEDVSVELFYGALNAQGEIENPKIALMKPTAKPKGTVYEFVGVNNLVMSGRLGHTVRVLPRHADLENPHKLGLVLWAK